jgi:LysR family glycine cleavage system transcriptional activator
MRRKIPSLQALACFDAAARHQSYTRAAQELALTQGAVSRQIGALEAFVGVALFQRTRHGVALTERGAEYAQQVAGRLQGLEQDTLEVMAGQGRSGSLQLAAVPTFATRWLIPRLPALAAVPFCLQTPTLMRPCTPAPPSRWPTGPAPGQCAC